MAKHGRRVPLVTLGLAIRSHKLLRGEIKIEFENLVIELLNFGH